MSLARSTGASSGPRTKPSQSSHAAGEEHLVLAGAVHLQVFMCGQGYQLQGAFLALSKVMSKQRYVLDEYNPGNQLSKNKEDFTFQTGLLTA